MLQPRWPKSGKEGGGWKPNLASSNPNVLAEKQMWRADPAWRQWGAGRMVDANGAGREVDMDTEGAGRVVDTGRADKVAKGGQQGDIAGRDGGRWLEGPKGAQGRRRNSDRWGGGKRILSGNL